MCCTEIFVDLWTIYIDFVVLFSLLLQEWYVNLAKSQCCLCGDGSLLETTELLTKLPTTDLSSVMSCKVRHMPHIHIRHTYHVHVDIFSRKHFPCVP